MAVEKLNLSKNPPFYSGRAHRNTVLSVGGVSLSCETPWVASCSPDTMCRIRLVGGDLWLTTGVRKVNARGNLSSTYLGATRA
ncbi:hypothetical protein CEXT_370431 [Caerostris extrusa]|uniref:Uncharacterized protein n=1 Tax=Caerostris extrusa TaxID=172846 RepID=A0AAV4RXM6_CAEEX|nr:hypothetical protein CEXT_370431 [Caerostris extrusa]